MARAIDMGVMPVVGLVLDMSDRDRDRLGRIANRAALGDVGIGLDFCKALFSLDSQDGSRGRGFAVINMTDRALR